MRTQTLSRVLAIVLAMALVAAVVLLVLPRNNQKHITAVFPRAVSLYNGSDVRILGVSVGKVDSVRPAGDKVVVKLSYDSKYKVPKDAKVALVSPAIVGDRFLQLTPVYTKGAVMADDANVGEDRTATPLELDQIFSSLNDLSKALGPDGANSSTDGKGQGALTRLLDSTARNFGGQGAEFNKTVTNVARLTKTLSDNKDELFGTARELEKFINTLAKNDTTVRQFNDSLASAADLLAGERGDLAAALRNLGTALVSVKGFVKDNRALLTKNISGLNTVTKTLVKRRDSLDSILKDAPLALNNLGLAYNPKVGVLNNRTSLTKGLTTTLANLGTFVCGGSAVPKALQGPCKTLLDPVGGALGGLNNRPAALSSTAIDPDRYVDAGLAGLVVAQR